MPSILLHPFWRYGAVVTCAFAALAAVVFTGYVNFLSAPWALGLLLQALLICRVVRQRPSTPVLKSYLLYLITMSGYFLLVYFLYATLPGPHPAETRAHIVWWSKFLHHASTILPAAHFSFTRRFARLDGKFWRIWEAIAWGHCGAFFIDAFLPNYVTSYVRVGNVVWVPTMDGLYQWLFYAVTLHLSVSCAGGWWALFTTQDSRHRVQMLYFVIGDTPLWLTCWSHFLMSMGVNIVPLGGFMVLWHISVMSYAVLFKRAFDFSIVIRRGMAYAFASVLLGLAYGLATWALVVEFNVSLSAGLVPAVLCLTMVGLLFAPLLEVIQRAIDRLFFREAVDCQELLAAFTREMASTIDLETVIRSTCVLLKDSLHPRAVKFYLLNEDGRPFLRAALAEEFDLQAASPGDILRDPLLELLRPGSKPERICLPTQRRSGAPIRIEDGDEHLLVPIRHRGALLGIVLLEPPRGRDQYETEDEQFAGTAAAQATVALLHARAYASMVRLQELTSRTLEGVPFGVLVATQQGNVSICNQSFRRMLKFPATPASLDQIREAHPELGERILPAIERNEAFENLDMDLNHGTTQCLLSLKVLTPPDELDAASRLYLLLLHDVTAYKRMEAVVRQREGLAQVGEMIASINHEISNILQPIRFQMQRLQELKGRSEPVHGALEIIPERLSALERLLANLRDLARPVEIRARNIDLPDLLESLSLELRRNAPEGTDIQIHCAPNACVCFADGHWLRQVLYDVGLVAVESCANAAHPTLRFSSYREEKSLKLSVQDNGRGMEGQQLEHLFEPFFAAAGRGACNFGMCLAKKLILLHGGSIDVSSTAGEGIRFLITLPAGKEVDELSVASSQNLSDVKVK